MPLKCVRYPARSENWYLRGTVGPYRVYESTGTRIKRDAERIRAGRERELLERYSLGAAATLTFAEAALVYMDNGGETRFLDPLLAYFGPDMRLADIDQAAVNGAAEALYPGAAWSTINRQVFTPISAVFKTVSDAGTIPARTFRRRKPPAGEDGTRLRWLEPEEAERLIGAANPRLRLLILFFLGTGARTSEGLYLTRERLYLETGQAFIDRTKTRAARMVRLPERTRTALAGADLPEAGAVFTRPDGEAYARISNAGGQIKTAFNAAVRRAGLERAVSPYTLRHTWATWYDHQTKDFGRLMDLGGWKSPEMAMRYRKLAPDDLGARLLAHGWDFRTETHAIARPHLATETR